MPPDPDALRATRNMAARLEREWRGRDAGTSDRYLPWMPFPIPDFTALVEEADRESSGNRFLEIGCGIGTKMLLAREIFGLTVTGIEISPQYALQAAGLGLDVVTGNAADFRGYGAYDLIWFYRPFADPDFQAGLEKRVWDGMAPGAVVICAALEAPPPPDQFHIILDDQELRRGIYMKPPRAPVA